MSLSLACYVSFASVKPGPGGKDLAYSVLIGCMLACILVMLPWSWRTHSHSKSVFYGGWLRRTGGHLWLGLRLGLWVSFVLAVLHAALEMQLPLPERRVSLDGDLLASAVMFYFGCLVLFGNVFGVHAIVLYRFFWHLFNRSSDPDPAGRRRGI